MVRSVSLFLALTAAMSIVTAVAFAQCELNIEYRVESSDTISIKSGETLSNVSVDLFDLRKGRVVATVESITLRKDDWTLLFKDVPPSAYALTVKFAECEKVVGGLGIHIKNTN